MTEFRDAVEKQKGSLTTDSNFSEASILDDNWSSG